MTIMGMADMVRTIMGTKEVGINRMQWNLRGEPVRPPAGFAGFGGGGMTDVPMETGAPAARPQAAASRPASGDEPFVDVDDIPF